MAKEIFNGKLATLAVLTFLAAVVCLVLFPVRDYDTFWHLANGQAMWEQGRIVQEELFSYTAKGTHFNNHAWLAQVIMYLFYALAGVNGLLLFKVLLTVGIFFLLYAWGRLLGASKVESAVLAAGAIVVGLSRFTVRPQLFSYLGVAGIGALLFGFRAGRLPRWSLILVPVGLLLWDTLHGAVYGYLLLLAFVAGETLKVCFRRRWDQSGLNSALDAVRFRWLWLWTLVAAGVSLLSPFGLRAYEEFWALLRKETSYSFAMTAEFMPTGWQGNIPFWILLFFVVFGLLRTRKTALDVTQFLLLLPFIYLSVRYSRATAVFAVVAVPIAAGLWGAFWQTVPGFRLGQPGRRLVLLGLALAVTGFVAQLKFIQPALQGGGPTRDGFGLGLNENLLPVGVGRFLVAVDLHGNMFNSDRLGGFLAYFSAPERPIFHYNHPSVFKKTFRFLHDPAQRDVWKHNYAIVSQQAEMKAFEDWVPVYWEPAAVLLVRPSANNSELIGQFRIRNFRPQLSNQQVREKLSNPAVASFLLREMGTYLQFRQDDRIAGLFGQYLAAGNVSLSISERENYLRQVSEFNGDNPQVHTAYGMISYQMKRWPEARKSFQRALQLNAELTQARQVLAYLELDAGSPELARNHFARLLKQDTRNANAIYGLALSEMEAGDTAAARESFRRYLVLVPSGKWAEKTRVYLGRLKD